MALAASSAPTTPGSGLNIATYVDPVTDKEYQAVVLVDSNGNPYTQDADGNLLVSNTTGTKQGIDSVTAVPRGTQASAVMAATGRPFTPAGKVVGIFVAFATSATSPSITLYNGNNTSGVVKIPTFTPESAKMYEFPSILVPDGAYLVITGTLSLIVYYDTTTG